MQLRIPGPTPCPDEVLRAQSKQMINHRGKEFSDDEWIKILVENPRLLRRPIVVNGNKAVLANPPENIEEIL